MRSQLLPLAVILVASSRAWGEAPTTIDPDVEVAHRHFSKGSELYEAGLYAEAVNEFEAAHDVKPLPAFDYNIGKCFDRLEQWSRAVEAYRRFLTASPNDPNAPEVHGRVTVLEHRMAEAQVRRVLNLAASPAPPRTEHRYLVPGVVAGGALALGVIGAGLLGSAAHRFNELAGSCAPSCAPGAGSTIEPLGVAGDVMLALAGAAAVVDIALWIRATKRRN